MKLYHPEINVELTFQNNGTRWLMVLEGSEAHIELAYNGLYNFCAVGKRTELNYTDHTRTKAWFWSSEGQMARYFYNHHHLKFASHKHALAHARREMELLRNSPTFFFDFTKPQTIPTFNLGTSKAERPDNNYCEMGLISGLRDRSSVKQVEKGLKELHA